jgi:hypothetical protein
MGCDHADATQMLGKKKIIIIILVVAYELHTLHGLRGQSREKKKVFSA